MAGDVFTQPNRPTLNPTALPVADVARLLSAAGGQRVTAEMIQADIDAGAPANVDGHDQLRPLNGRAKEATQRREG